ncbi:hypothetical protein KCU61_g615, partial [Aureobasidium melanogenum]
MNMSFTSLLHHIDHESTRVVGLSHQTTRADDTTQTSVGLYRGGSRATSRVTVRSVASMVQCPPRPASAMSTVCDQGNIDGPLYKRQSEQARTAADHPVNTPSFVLLDAVHSVLCRRLPTSKFDRHIADHPNFALASNPHTISSTGQVVGLHSHSDHFLDAEKMFCDSRVWMFRAVNLILSRIGCHSLAMWPLTYESNLVEHASVWGDKFAEVAIHAQAKKPGHFGKRHQVRK